MKCIRVEAETPDGNTEPAIVPVDAIQLVTPGRIRLSSGHTVRIDPAIPLYDVLVCIAHASVTPSSAPMVGDTSVADPVDAVRQIALALRSEHGDPGGLGTRLLDEVIVLDLERGGWDE